MSDHLERNRELMRIALSAAVPLWIMRLKRRSEEHRVKRGYVHNTRWTAAKKHLLAALGKNRVEIRIKS